MAKKYYSTLTKIGLNAVARATMMNEKVKFSKFCLGDAEINPDVNTTALGHEIWQGSISSIVVDENNPNWIVLTCIISATVGGFTIREVGIKDEDGNLLAVASYPETYKPVLAEGAGKDLIVRVILEVSNTECVELKIDPTVSLATKSDLEAIEKKKADKEEVKKLEKKVETVEQTVENSIGDLDISEKEIKLIEEAPEELPVGKETLGVILSKFKKFLQKLHVEARTYAKTNTTNTFDGVQVFNNTIRSTTSDSSLEVRTIQGPTANGQDGNLYLNVYDPSKTVHFTTPDGVYHTLQELFQSVSDGKSVLIAEINKLIGHDSGLTAQNTWNDFAWFLKNKTIDYNKLYYYITNYTNYSLPNSPNVNGIEKDRLNKYFVNHSAESYNAVTLYNSSLTININEQKKCTNLFGAPRDVHHSTFYITGTVYIKNIQNTNKAPIIITFQEYVEGRHVMHRNVLLYDKDFNFNIYANRDNPFIYQIYYTSPVMFNVSIEVSNSDGDIVRYFADDIKTPMQ